MNVLSCFVNANLRMFMQQASIKQFEAVLRICQNHRVDPAKRMRTALAVTVR